MEHEHKQDTFSFPPDENFDDQWQVILATVQRAELNGKPESLKILGYYLEDYRERLLDSSPPFIEEASKIDDLSALVVRAKNSFLPN